MKVYDIEISPENALKIDIGQIRELESVPGMIDSIMKEIKNEIETRNAGLDGLITSGDPTLNGEAIFAEAAKSIQNDYYDVLNTSSIQLNGIIDLAEAREEKELTTWEAALEAARDDYKSKRDAAKQEKIRLENDKGDENSSEPPPDHSAEIAKQQAIYDENDGYYRECLVKIEEVGNAKATMHSAYGLEIVYDANSKTLTISGVSRVVNSINEISDGKGHKVGYVSTGFDEDGNYYVLRNEFNDEGALYTTTYTYKDGPDGELLSKRIESADHTRSVEIGYKPDGSSTVKVTERGDDGSVTTYETNYGTDGKPSENTIVTKTAANGDVTTSTVSTEKINADGESHLATDTELAKPKSSEEASSNTWSGNSKTSDDPGQNKEEEDDDAPLFATDDHYEIRQNENGQYVVFKDGMEIGGGSTEEAAKNVIAIDRQIPNHLAISEFADKNEIPSLQAPDLSEYSQKVTVGGKTRFLDKNGKVLYEVERGTTAYGGGEYYTRTIGSNYETIQRFPDGRVVVTRHIDGKDYVISATSVGDTSTVVTNIDGVTNTYENNFRTSASVSDIVFNFDKNNAGTISLSRKGTNAELGTATVVDGKLTSISVGGVTLSYDNGKTNYIVQKPFDFRSVTETTYIVGSDGNRYTVQPNNGQLQIIKENGTILATGSSDQLAKGYGQWVIGACTEDYHSIDYYQKLFNKLNN